ncbi:MAG: hypothetical protein AAF628_31760 [Planctomycetota bacterium]
MPTILAALLVLTPSTAQPPAAAPVPIAARLILDTAAEAAAVTGGGPRLGVEVRIAKGWHVRYRVPGGLDEPGEALAVEWLLPDSATAGATTWPVPVVLPSANTPTPPRFGYRDAVVLWTTLDVAAGARIEPADVGADVRWVARHTDGRRRRGEAHFDAAQTVTEAAPASRADRANAELDLALPRGAPPTLPPLTAPRYGLFLCGPAADTPVWAVLDRPRADAPAFDTLYLDLNGNGDLREPGERFANAEPTTKKRRSTFNVGPFADPATGAPRDTLKLAYVAGFRRSCQLITTVQWRHPTTPEPDDAAIRVLSSGWGATYFRSARFAKSAAAAPIYVLDTTRPFAFQRFDLFGYPRGETRLFRVLVGNPGSEPGTFTAIDERQLPREDYPVATLLYRHVDGAAKALRFGLTGTCCDHHYSADLRAPADAAVGPATVLLHMRPGSRFRAFPTEIPVRIE